MQIKLNSVFVDDQEKAAQFYTGVLGFVKRHDIDMGGPRWLTVYSSEAPDGAELLLEPNGNPAAHVYQKALYDQGIPATAFASADIHAEYARLKALGVVFRGEPRAMGETTAVAFEDTCGNLIQLYQI
jgi:catechol 2,3-dioxygenase-like lactoylglutathione lyase family enzyme